MNHRLWGLWLAAPLLLLGLRAQSQTLYGPGGLFVHPTAFTPRRGVFQFNLSYFTQKAESETQGEYLPFSLAYSPTDRLQIGAIYLHRRFGTTENESGGAFAKVQLLADGAAHPAVALVGSILGGDFRQGSLAAVASHDFRRGGHHLVTLHVGLQLTRWQDSDSLSPSASLSAFTGLVIPLKYGFSLLGEVGSRFAFDRKETSGFGIQYTARGGYTLGVGFVNTGRGDDNRFFVGVGFPSGD